MPDVLSDWVRLPFRAIASGMEMLTAQVDMEQRVNAALARMAHQFTGGDLHGVNGLEKAGTMTTQQEPAGPEARVAVPTPGIEKDARVLPTVSEYLARGMALKRWWTEVERNGGPADRFQLER